MRFNLRFVQCQLVRNFKKNINHLRQLNLTSNITAHITARHFFERMAAPDGPYAHIDFTYPSAITDKRHKLPTDDGDTLCPMHQKLKQRNESEKKKKKKLNFFRHFYERKSSLERKLEYHGIKIKVEHKRKKIHPVEFEE